MIIPTSYQYLNSIRQAQDLKLGVPVIIYDKKIQKAKMIFATDNYNLSTILHLYQNYKEKYNIQDINIRIAINNIRTNFILDHYLKKNISNNSKNSINYSLDIDNNNSSTNDNNINKFSHIIDNISGLDFSSSNILQELFKDKNHITTTDNIDNTAIALCKTTHILPSIISFAVKIDYIKELCEEYNLISNSTTETENYLKHRNDKFIFRHSTDIQLKASNNCKIYYFSSTTTGEQAYCITIDDINNYEDSMVRIHSSCYTGDLVESLRCDCGKQLITSLDIMAKYKKGGMLIYLMQEGRGIGLLNKLRSYSTQQRLNMDTVEGNLNLGYQDDERLFDAARDILNYLKKTNIKLITNNPAKVSIIKKLGFNITERIPLIIKTNPYNEYYLKTKQNKSGHLLNYVSKINDSSNSDNDKCKKS